MRTAFESLNQVNLQTVLQQKCIRQALALALEAVVQANSPEQRLRAWKLWFLLPRLLLHRPPSTRTLPKQAWHARMIAFQAGQWMQLLDAAGATQTQANTDQHQPSTTTGPTEERQARRACQLVHQGDHTLQQLRDPVRRPIPTNTQHQPKQFSQLAFPTPTLTSRPTSYSPTCDGHGREQLQGHQASQQKPCDSCSTMSTPLRWHASRHH